MCVCMLRVNIQSCYFTKNFLTRVKNSKRVFYFIFNYYGFIKFPEIRRIVKIEIQLRKARCCVVWQNITLIMCYMTRASEIGCFIHLLELWTVFNLKRLEIFTVLSGTFPTY